MFFYLYLHQINSRKFNESTKNFKNFSFNFSIIVTCIYKSTSNNFIY